MKFKTYNLISEIKQKQIREKPYQKKNNNKNKKISPETLNDKPWIASQVARIAEETLISFQCKINDA